MEEFDIDKITDHYKEVYRSHIAKTCGVYSECIFCQVEQIKKTPENKLDKYHYHELVDRAYVANESFFEYVRNHPVVEQHKDLLEMADSIV